MTKTELYDLAQTTGRNLAAETDELKLEAAIIAAAQSGNVTGPDYGQFKSFVQQAKHTYFVLGTQKLPSEVIAAQQAKTAKPITILPQVPPGALSILPQTPPETAA